jgi:hypothetical protein
MMALFSFFTSVSREEDRGMDIICPPDPATEMEREKKNIE